MTEPSRTASGEQDAASLHLPPRHREQIQELLQQHLPDVEVWAYGSRASGKSHDGSDLDLVLRGPDLAPVDVSALAGLLDALRDSTVPFLVEARDWARLPESFHREIERGYVVLRRGIRKPLGRWLVENVPHGIELELPDRKNEPEREIPFQTDEWD